MKTAKVHVKHLMGDGTLGEYINEHLYRGQAVLIIPGHEYLEYEEKPKELSRDDFLDLGAKRM